MTHLAACVNFITIQHTIPRFYRGFLLQFIPKTRHFVTLYQKARLLQWCHFE